MILFCRTEEERRSLADLLDAWDYACKSLNNPSGENCFMLQYEGRYKASRPLWLPCLTSLSSSAFSIRSYTETVEGKIPNFTIADIDEYLDHLKFLQALLMEISDRIDPSYVAGAL